MSAQAASGKDPFSGEPACVVRGDERDDVGDVLRLTKTPKRGLGNDASLEIRSDHPRRLGSFRLGEIGAHGIDPDLPRTEFPGQHACDRIERAFARGVDRRLRRRDGGDTGTDVDDAAPFAEMACVNRRGKGTPLGV